MSKSMGMGMVNGLWVCVLGKLFSVNISVVQVAL